MRHLVRPLTAVAVAAVILLGGTQGAGAAGFPHGPHASGTMTDGACEGYGVHSVPSSGYLGYGSINRYNGSTCDHLSVQLTCYTIYGVPVATGYVSTPNGTASGTTVYYDACNQLYSSDHNFFSTSSNHTLYGFAS